MLVALPWGKLLARGGEYYWPVTGDRTERLQRDHAHAQGDNPGALDSRSGDGFHIEILMVRRHDPSDTLV